MGSITLARVICVFVWAACACLALAPAVAYPSAVPRWLGAFAYSLLVPGGLICLVFLMFDCWRCTAFRRLHIVRYTMKVTILPIAIMYYSAMWLIPSGDDLQLELAKTIFVISGIITAFFVISIASLFATLVGPILRALKVVR